MAPKTEDELLYDRRSDSERLRQRRENLRVMSVPNLLNHAHGWLMSIHADRVGEDRREARVAAAGVAAVAHELDSRGRGSEAATLRAHRTTARTAHVIHWTRDYMNRPIPVAMPPRFDIMTGRIPRATVRRERSRARTR
jgi:hypothetical protein